MVAVTQIPARYVDLKGASTYSGMSVDALRDKVRAGELTPYRPTGKTLIDLRELDALVQAAADKSSSRGRHLHAAADATE